MRTDEHGRRPSRQLVEIRQAEVNDALRTLIKWDRPSGAVVYSTRLHDTLDSARWSIREDIRIAATWIAYVEARGELSIDGRKFTLESTLAELAEALEDTMTLSVDEMLSTLRDRCGQPPFIQAYSDGTWTVWNRYPPRGPSYVGEGKTFTDALRAALEATRAD